MKKNFIYALMSAIAFVGAAGLAACSSSDEIIDNPDYNPETNSVKTTITLSVNPANANVSGNAGTRQTDAICQKDGSFRGITNMILVPSVGLAGASNVTTNKIELEDFTFDASTNHKLYADKDVTVGVTHFLFLGKAKNSAAVSSSDITTKLASGFTENTISTASTVGAITITPQPIATTTGSWTTQTTALVTYLNSIADADGWKGNANTSLNDWHTKFTRTTLTAGSASSVLLMLQDMYRKLEDLKSVDATTVGNIRTKILTQVSATGDDPKTATLAWKSDCPFKSFPTDLGLPEGAAQYKYNSTTFEYVSDGSNATATAVSNFIYPNELYYLTNTPIKASSSKTVTWPATAENWKDSEWGDWTDAVASGTKNIALKYNIQYGSALLATQVKCKAATLYDNAKNFGQDANSSITISDESNFKLTGVIVGGQPTLVGWNFLPASTATFTYAVYDRLTETPVNTEYTAANYTLVFDDYKTAEEKDVNVCLEFLNNAKDFYGKDGIILKGQKFYLVGKLKVTDKTDEDNPFKTIGTDDAEDSYFPSRVLRGFIQDFTTTAQFIITEGSEDGTTPGSLKNALSTIPDLRVTQQTIGLSVDVNWRSGLTFESNLGQ